MGCIIRLTAILALVTSSQVSLVSTALAGLGSVGNLAVASNISRKYDSFNKHLGNEDGIAKDASDDSGSRFADSPHQAGGLPEDDGQEGAGSR